MSNTVEYILSLQDQMSAKLQKIGIGSDNALSKFAKLQKQSTETSKVMKEMGGSVGALKEKLGLLKSEKDWIPSSQITNIGLYNKEIRKLENQISKLEKAGAGKLRTWFSDAFNQVPFGGLLTNPLVVAGALAGKAIKVGVEDEMQRTSFEVLLGGKEAAEQLVNDIKKYADKTPFEKLGLGDAAKTMLGFGIAQDKVMPNLKMLGDIAMGDANKLSSLTLAFSQISSAGKLQGQDLLQLINAGFNPLQEISKSTGKSMAELKKEMEKGNITFDMVSSAFQTATAEGGKFHGMADKMSETVGGRWSSAMDKINEVFLKLYNVISPILIPAIDFMTGTIDVLLNSVGWLFNGLADGNPWIWALVGSVTALTVAMSWSSIVMKAQNFWLNLLIIKERALTLWTNLSSLALKAKAIGLGVVTAATWLWNAALDANPIGAIILAVTALSAALYGLQQLMAGVSAEEEAGAKIKQRVIDKTVDQRVQLDLLFEVLKKSTKGSSDFNNTLKELERMQPGIVEKYNLQAGSLKDINLAYADMAGNIDKVAKAEASQELLKETYKKIFLLEAEKKKPNYNLIGDKVTSKYRDEALDAQIKDLKKEVDIYSSDGKKQGLEDIKKMFNTPTGLGLDPSGTGKGTGTKTNTGKKTNEAIATGGSKNVVNNFTFKNMIENISIAKQGFKESAEEIQRNLEDALLRTLAMADSTAG